MHQLKRMSANIRDPRIELLLKNISPFYIRIKKSDLGIPKPIEHDPIIVKMGPLQRQIYDFIENKYIASLQADAQSASFRNDVTKAKLIRLMQATTNPSLLKKPLELYYKEQGLTDSLIIDDSEVLSIISEYDKKEIPEKLLLLKN
jgi:hypothetical protein